MKTMEESGYVDGYTDESTGDIGVEIYGRDVIHLNGKVTSKTPLLTAAQDFAGAINELFQSDPGGGDEWEFPEHWPDIPEPAPNQVVVYLEVDEPGYGFPVQFYSHLSDDYFGGGTIDWGDGTVDTVVGGDITVSQAIIAHQYTAAGQYIATITCGTDETGIYAAYLNNSFAGGVSYSSLHQKWVKAIKVGALVETCASSNESVNGSNYAAFSRYVNIVYLKFIGKPLYCYFSNMRYLKKIEFGADIAKLPINAFANCANLERVDFTGKITDFPQYAFQGCYALKSVDLSSAITIGSGAFQSCFQLKSVTTPLLTEIQSYAFSNCYSLKSFNAPLLTAMGNQSFSNCYSGLKIFEAPMLAEIGQNEFSNCFALEKLTLAEGCNYNGNTFSSCQLLYPKPQ